MQTPAESHLVDQICGFLEARKNDEVARPILNIGSCRSVLIEKEISARGLEYICDRVDVEDCSVQLPGVRHCWKCSVEEMEPVGSDEYYLAFANYLLEHVSDLRRAAGEIHRVLCSSGVFVTSLPNPTAPEFILARYTPLSYHRIIRRSDAFETVYPYGRVSELMKVFESVGFAPLDVRYWPFTQGYLYRYPIAGVLSRWYDAVISRLSIRRFMGNVCITFKKE
jgi:SAM-dependent methyltransferase